MASSWVKLQMILTLLKDFKFVVNFCHLMYILENVVVLKKI